MSIFKKSSGKNAIGVKSLQELEAPSNSSWLKIVQLAEGASHVNILPVSNDKVGQETLLSLQVSTRSYMGAVARYSGGLIFDNGWLRLYGSGSARVPNISQVNGLPRVPVEGYQPPHIDVGHDALGGLFRIWGNGPAAGSICYFAPDALEWQDLELGYGDFVAGLLTDQLNLDKFYENFRWQGWQQDVAALDGGEAYSFYPPLSTAEGQDINKVYRRKVPLEEILNLFGSGK